MVEAEGRRTLQHPSALAIRIGRWCYVRARLRMTKKSGGMLFLTVLFLIVEVFFFDTKNNLVGL